MAQQEPSGLVAGEDDSTRDRVFHTVTACARCRQRKTRCDPGLPQCEACERSGAHCEYFDSTSNRIISRSYITSLQSHVARLHEQLVALEDQEKNQLDPEEMMRGPNWIQLDPHAEPRFLGPSSGIAVTRFVMELAKQNTSNKDIRAVISQVTAQEIKKSFEDESGKPTSKIYPEISSVPAPDLPTTGLMERLIEIYMAKAQYMLPLFHEPTFRQQMQSVFDGDKDPILNFQLRLVLAISMQKLEVPYAGLADSYYLAALPFLEAVLRKRDISSLQCLVLIAQYSTLTPSRTASYWVVGMAVEIAKEMHLYVEKDITEWPPGNKFDVLEIDMRRRLSWIILSMEYGLSHSLGRPCALSFKGSIPRVQFFHLCDDRYITPQGTPATNPPVMKKCIAVHFFKMRLFQWEIRRTLYLRRRGEPEHDLDPWYKTMERKLDQWVAGSPKNDEGSGLSGLWFQGRRNTMIVFMYRPSPQIPVPSDQAAERCFQASVANVQLQSHQMAQKTVDVTWIFTQALFMALNTILWSLAYPSIRQQHPLEEVKPHLNTALQAIEMTAKRWPGVRSATQLYQNLIEACLRAYSSNESFVIEKPSFTDIPVNTIPDAFNSSIPQFLPLPLGQSYRETSTGSDPAFSSHRSPASMTDSSAFTLDGTSSSVSPEQQQAYLDFNAPFPVADRSASAVPFIPDTGMLPTATGSFPININTTPWTAPTKPPATNPYFEPGNFNPGNFNMDWTPGWGTDLSEELIDPAQYPFSRSGQRIPSLTEDEQLQQLGQLEHGELPGVPDMMADVTVTYDSGAHFL